MGKAKRKEDEENPYEKLTSESQVYFLPQDAQTAQKTVIHCLANATRSISIACSEMANPDENENVSEVMICFGCDLIVPNVAIP